MRNTNILIIEKEASEAARICASLKESGYNLAGVVDSGEEAIETIRKRVVDLILLDTAHFYELEDFAAVEKMRATFDIPVIYLSQPEHESFLEKSFTTDPYSEPPIVVPPFGHDLQWAIRSILSGIEKDVLGVDLNNAFRNILETAPEGILIFKSGRVLFANIAAGRMLGIKNRNGLRGRRILNLIHRQDLERFLNYSNLSPQSCTWNADWFEARLIGENGRTLETEMSITSLQFPAGMARQLHFRDIYDKKRLAVEVRTRSEKLEKLTSELESRIIAEQTLRKEKEKLLFHQSRLAAVGEMVGAIAHQWKQPLNSLGLIVQSLQDAYESGDLDREEMDQSVHMAMDLIRFMAGTVDDFRNFLKPSRKRERFNVPNAVLEIIRFLEVEMCHSSIVLSNDFESNIDPSLLVVDGYKNEFKHTILNILSNARMAILEKRIRESEAKKEIDDSNITSATGAGAMDGADGDFIRISFSLDGKQLVLSIQDSGGGIPPEYLSRIFDPYFTTRESSGGSGIGLYIVKQIVESELKGSITAENRDRGALFEVRVPLSVPSSNAD